MVVQASYGLDKRLYNIGKGNRLEAYNGIEYTYDALGNMIYRQLPNGESQLFQYDTENQLVLAEIKKNSGESQTWEYAYDPFGRRLSKERTDKGALTATAPKQTHFVWDGSRLLQEYNYRGSYSYIYTDQDSYEPLAQIFDNAKDGKQYLSYFHTDQIGIPREMTDQLGNLLWYGEYTAWGRLKTDERVYQHAHQPFRLQNQYCDEETGLHYNLFRYYEPDCGRFVNQDPIGLLGGDNFYEFALNAVNWVDTLGLRRTFGQRIGDFGERSLMKYLKGTGYREVFSVQNASGNGLDVVARRRDGKFDIFEVKSSMSGNFKLSEAQAKGGKAYAKKVLGQDVLRGGYYKIDINGNKTKISPKEASRILNNINKTEQVNIDVGRCAKTKKFFNKLMTFKPW
ncbi:RHS domain-containing protein [Neisseria sp. Dent CA1/247]|uniref:RHS repeat domain-containing protein n=1 Tax=Neisseria sp. Dent CA1/247 TaxID=2912675 RepID=UPI001FD0D2CD|nr:RHS repeat-associated core domain-containing protein [Neisseria sp. Dent CA1/247]UOO78255.1 RHS domain-containing protein [Neisseria sp. Dent CA1/247]